MKPGMQVLLLCLLSLGIAACGSLVEQADSAPASPRAEIPPDAVPRDEPRSRYGNPKSYVVFGKRYYTLAAADGFVQRGTASWYGKKFHGRRTSSGEPYDMYAMTAAHKSLPLPSYVAVRNLSNGRSTVVKVNDRGPFHGDRIIDLSYSAARKLDMVGAGTAPVEIRVLLPAGGAPEQAPVNSAQSGEPHFVQAGAFLSADNAALREAQVRSLVNAPVVARAMLRGARTLHVVRVGPLASRVQAEQLTRRLLNAGILGVHVVSSN